jgi:hypothetical protein
MGQTQIWRGLEREVRAHGSLVAFTRARERHEVLRAYPDLPAAVAAGVRCRCEQRDAIVAAFLAEYRATRAGVWSAAAILAMSPVVLFLVRVLKGATGDRNDEASIVLTAFLEAANTIRTADRISLRLYSETRRRALRFRRVSLKGGARRSHVEVEDLGAADDAEIESRIDMARFIWRARAVAPEYFERPAAYIERLLPSSSRRERLSRRALLSNQRSASLADLREAFRNATAHRGDT